MDGLKFKMENPIEMDHLGGTPIFGNTHLGLLAFLPSLGVRETLEELKWHHGAWSDGWTPDVPGVPMHVDGPKIIVRILRFQKRWAQKRSWEMEVKYSSNEN